MSERLALKKYEDTSDAGSSTVSSKPAKKSKRQETSGSESSVVVQASKSKPKKPKASPVKRVSGCFVL